MLIKPIEVSVSVGAASGESSKNATVYIETPSEFAVIN